MENLVTSSIKKSEIGISELHEISPELAEQISGGRCEGTVTGSHAPDGSVTYSIDGAK
jgi:hypothetical protein